MGLFDKLKNVFFEEEEVEVEEVEEPKEKVAVAKKIDVEETKKNEEANRVTNNTLEFEKKEEDKEKDFKFPMGFDDKDFEVEKTMEIFARNREPEKKEEIEEIEEINHDTFEVTDEPPVEVEKVKEEPVHYHYEEVKYEKIKPATRVVEQRETVVEHRLYEGREKREEPVKPAFTPSPIISPIYGVLNKNYKKEEIITKAELNSSKTSQKKDNLDLIREKAYGDLAGDISASIEDEVIDIKKEEEKKDVVYDLTEEEPIVKVVTVGDAEEYFNDLGLEYNVDYKVESKEEDKKEEPIEKIEKVEKKTRVEKNNDQDDDDDENDKNLFDLIDAMYEDEEK